jgi:ribosome biogenesis GTPase A
MNSVTGDGVKKLLAVLAGVAGERQSGHAEGGARGESGEAHRPKASKPLRAMVVGVPNSGKSSLINRLTGRRSAQTGDRPGITKGKQWLTLENGVRLLDTPGILWPKFEDPNVGLNLAFCGSIRDEIMDVPDLALELIRSLESLYPGALARRFGLEKDVLGEREGDEADLSLALMETIARGRGCILPGKRIDYERAGRMLLDEFRSGKLGRVTLERP